MSEKQLITPCLTLKEVAARLNCSLRTVEKMIAAREIVGFKVGNEWRIRPEWLEKWIEKKEKAA